MIFDFISFYFIFFERFAHYWWYVLPMFLLVNYLDRFWIYNQIYDHFKREKYVILRIKVPREQVQTPLMMENVIHGAWSIAGDPRHFMDVYVFNEKEDYISFEIVGVEGEIFFGIWVRKAKAEYIKTHIYSQYPDAEIEILEDDYLNIVPNDIPNDEWNMWGVRWILQKPDAYPIKTYKHFEDSVSGSMVDPLASFMEVLSTLGPGELLIYQVLALPVTEGAWKADFQAEVEKILDRGNADEKKSVLDDLVKHYESFPMDTLASAFKHYELKESEKDETAKAFENLMFKLSPGEQQWIKEMEESHGKRHYKCQYATVYAARKDVMNNDRYVGSMLGAVNQFTSTSLNGFNVYLPYMTSTKYWAEKKRLDYTKRLLWRVTKQRKFSGSFYYLNSEEIATLWHFPDMAIKAPKTPWVDSKKASAPHNLPIKRENN